MPFADDMPSMDRTRVFRLAACHRAELHLQGQHDQQAHGNRAGASGVIQFDVSFDHPGEIRTMVNGSPDSTVYFTNARTVGTVLRRAGMNATRSTGTRIRGAPIVTPGYQASKYKLLDHPDQVVKVGWQNSWHRDADKQPDPKEQNRKIGSALTDDGYVVTAAADGGEMVVWGKRKDR